MFAQLTKTDDGYDLPVVSIHRARAITVGEGKKLIQHPASIFSRWSKEELLSIGHPPIQIASIPAGEISTATEDEIVNGVVIRSHVLIDDPELFNRQKKELLQSLKSKREMVINAGLPWNGEVVQTDESSRNKIVGAVVRNEKAGTTHQAWRMLSDNSVIFTAVDFEALAVAVANLVDEAFIRYTQLEQEIKDSEDLSLIDIDTGWPDHYVPVIEGPAPIPSEGT